MYIDDRNFVRRKVLQENKGAAYSPKKRWDEGSFGSQRALLFNHVQNTLKEHQNDGDILEKFRKQAEELKERKRRQKFPHLYLSENTLQNRLQYEPQIHQSSLILPKQCFPNKNFEFQPQYRTIQQPVTQQQPQPIQSMRNPKQNSMFPFQTIQSHLQYERIISQKDLELYKRSEKIRRQNNKIQKLYRELKNRQNEQLKQKEEYRLKELQRQKRQFLQKEEQLQKYINYHNEIKKMNNALISIKAEISDRKSRQKDKKRSLNYQNHTKSEVFLNYEDSLPIVSRMSTFDYAKQQRSSSIEQNPEVVYSPKLKQNRSNLFQQVNLYNPIVKLSETDNHLQELVNYNKKLEHFRSKNSEKMKKIQ